jgi:DNA repair exonuclease SbcCD ATPase subunit
LRKEFEERESAWKAERDELRTQLAAAVCTLPPTAAAAPVLDDDARRQLAELQEERAVLEAELTLMRSRAADLQEQAAEHKRQLAERQNELTAELKQLREALAAKPWENAPAICGAGAAAVAPPAESSLTITQPPPAPPAMSAASAEKEKPADPLVNSVMAQFARLQKDVAQRRKQK